MDKENTPSVQEEGITIRPQLIFYSSNLFKLIIH